ncbi:MAG: DUF58 domain-containing protein [Planctomycetes bacterium]|nr:DUF58 domain-containing protein [Planctomycetota bacterium]
MGKINRLLSPQMVSKIATVALRARHLVEGTLSGIHKSPHKGSSVEFLEHKRYTPGDEIKNIDWKLVARSDRIYVKQFEDETNLRAMLVVDNSRSMDYGPTGRKKIEYTQLAAAAFCYLLLSQSDAAGLLSQQGDKRLYVPPRGNWSHYRAITGALGGLQARGQNHWLDHLIELASSFRKRSMFLIFTDLLVEREEMLTALRLLKDRRQEVLMFHILHPYEVEFPFDGPRMFRDLENPELNILADPETTRQQYQERVDELKRFYRDKMARMEQEYHFLRTDSPLEQSLVHYLARREARAP